ncbi:helix-turn-helix domain-containing protein [Chryseobacterium sp. RR2-3-20]|uniref:helix-turn-helix domain-containing protein n=1 Tax=Chryseobacterium sp. RR2-3-20 TaxID=2787626 RepID=UPI001AE0A99F|nr:helix-turn-helix transcriptional regulator [Chryseobacterium sp. RR2-3-20]
MSFFGTNIKKIRHVKGLSQKAFGDLFELNRGVISAYEEGRAEPKIETLLKVAHYFNLDIDDFLTKPLQVNDLVSGSVIDTLMFSPIENFKKTQTEQNLSDANSSKNKILQKILATVDFIYEFTDEKKTLPFYNSGDILFLVKADFNSERNETLFFLENENIHNLSEIPEKKWKEKEIYKIAGHLSLHQKNVFSDILKRIENLENFIKKQPNN